MDTDELIDAGCCALTLFGCFSFPTRNQGLPLDIVVYISSRKPSKTEWDTMAWLKVHLPSTLNLTFFFTAQNTSIIGALPWL